MAESGFPPIAFAEWLTTGVMVHFEGGKSVFYPAGFLFEHSDAGEIRQFPPDAGPIGSSHDQ